VNQPNEYVLELRHITRTFPGVRALDNVTFACRPAEVHAVVGENGAGKSTLMKIVAGALAPDAGEIIAHGRQVRFEGPREAQRLGISVVYQEFNLLPHMSVAENIFLGREPRTRLGLLDWDRLRRDARAVLDRLAVRLDPSVSVGRLSVAQQQEVEIAKALSFHAEIILMDEPSAVLAGNELERLFEIIGALKQQGVTVIYISHRLAEVFQISDRVTVLKDGQLIGTVRTAEVSRPELIRMMVGRPLEEAFPEPGHGEGHLRLSVRGLSNDAVRDVSFDVRGGEIVGLAGLVGAGRTSLARALFGADPVAGGEIVLDGRPLQHGSPRAALRGGLALVPEDRKTQGLVLGLSVRKNVSLPILDRLQRWGLLSRRREREVVAAAIRDLKVRTPSLDQEVQYLSGGNQQKVVFAKWLTTAPRVLILDEPTRGIDVATKAEIYLLMRALASAGSGILLISSELPELLGMSDRILVMRDGRIAGELSRAEATEEKILALATSEDLDERAA
jgi:ribose transport system ATP-binding protein